MTYIRTFPNTICVFKGNSYPPLNISYLCRHGKKYYCGCYIVMVMVEWHPRINGWRSPWWQGLELLSPSRWWDRRRLRSWTGLVLSFSKNIGKRKTKPGTFQWNSSALRGQAERWIDKQQLPPSSRNRSINPSHTKLIYNTVKITMIAVMPFFK